MGNHLNDKLLLLAVAGSRKTQSIVDACVVAKPEEKILVLTYTKNNQDELTRRLSCVLGNRHNVDVTGWYAFLISNFAKPHLPFVFEGRRVNGFDFEGQPMQGVASDNYIRYFNKLGQARRPHLAQLCWLIEKACSGESIIRLERIYDHIYIDEMQDLCGWDLEIISLLLDSRLSLTMVGDVRQAILVTNPRERKNKQYMYMKIWDWFLKMNAQNRLAIEYRSDTWRCRPEIAAFADSCFSPSLGFPPTNSLNEIQTNHDGIFFIRRRNIQTYINLFSPLFLRYSANSARNEPYDFMNIGKSKGLTSKHVLIWTTAPMEQFIFRLVPFDLSQAASMYVAVTRAEQSVAFVIADDFNLRPEFEEWMPTTQNLV